MTTSDQQPHAEANPSVVTMAEVARHLGQLESKIEHVHSDVKTYQEQSEQNRQEVQDLKYSQKRQQGVIAAVSVIVSSGVTFVLTKILPYLKGIGH